MLKLFLVILTLLLGSLLPLKTASAQEKNSAVLVNPVRGKDFWNYNFSLTETPRAQYGIIKSHGLPATWLIRYDALTDPEVQSFIKSLDASQEIGIFFEITPGITRDAGVSYNQSENWHLAKSVLLTGYSPEDRIRLIDTAFKKFNEITGKTPKSVGAWWIDAYSLGYMKDKYGIEANLDVADQYTTDGYQVWGQYWSTPFYPSKLNALMPAQSEEQKMGVVTMQWATRDPYNGYGHGVFESTYSVQANDYILHNLGSDYFEKLLNIYPQTTVGIENDFDFSKFGEEYKKQIDLIAGLKNQGRLRVYGMQQYAGVYMKENPGISPQVVISADDPLGSSGKAVWVMNPRYRAGLFFGSAGVEIRDLRFYGDSTKEECFDKKCEQLKLAFSQNSAIDEGNFNSKWVIDDGPADNISVQTNGENVEVKYKTQSGIDKSITFLPNDIKIGDKIYTIQVAIINALQNQSAKADEGSFESKIDTGALVKQLLPDAFMFFGLLILFFLLPGLIFTKDTSVALVLGFTLFTLSVFLLGFLGKISPVFTSNNWLWGLPVISAALSYKRLIKGLKEIKNIRPGMKQAGIFALIFSGSIVWSLTSIKNGLVYNYGLGFWGPNGHDAIWHLSLISELTKNFPPQNPIYSGIPLTNYHYFYDLLVAKFAAISGLSILDLVFRFFPVFFALLAGTLIYKLTFKISKSFTASFWATFFLYFGGSFGWVISYFRNGDFGGETMFWSQQSISTLLNPPFAASLVMLLAGLLVFYRLKEKFSAVDLAAAAVLFGSLIEFKAYGGVLIVGSLFLYGAERVFRKDIKFLALFFLAALISAVVFLPNNSGSESLIEFLPLWLVNTMITSQDRLNWYRMTITLQSAVPYKLIYAYSVGTFIFILGNFGTRLTGLFSLKELWRERVLFYILLFSVIFPLLFIQKGNSWNIVQFIYYGLFIMAIFAGISLGKLSKILPKAVYGIVAVIIVLLTLPTTANTLTQYLPARPPARLSVDEYEALSFLRTQPAGVVLSYPFEEKSKSFFQTPLPLAAYTSTAYVSAFSGKQSFIEDTINLEILGIDGKPRINLAREIFRNQNKAKELLTQNGISYVYLFKPLKIEFDENKVGVKNIYENGEVKIFKVLE